MARGPRRAPPGPGSGPTAERRRHPALPGQPAVTAAGPVAADAAGRPARPRLRCLDTLAAMHRQGTIDARLLAAGRRFESAYQEGWRHPLAAADPTRPPGRGGGTTPLAPPGLQRQGEVLAALEALGGRASPTGSAAEAVLGWGESLSAWARGQSWGRRPLTPDRAAGMLIAALALLARHYERGRGGGAGGGRPAPPGGG